MPNIKDIHVCCKLTPPDGGKALGAGFCRVIFHIDLHEGAEGHTDGQM